MKEITKEWIKKAEEDYMVAVRESKLPPFPTYTVCFHSQQCVEKYMKAILQENGVSFGKIHDLEILLKDCKKFLPELEDFREELIWLTTFAVEIRYPGFNATKKEAKKSVRYYEKNTKSAKKIF